MLLLLASLNPLVPYLGDIFTTKFQRFQTELKNIKSFSAPKLSCDLVSLRLYVTTQEDQNSKHEPNSVWVKMPEKMDTFKNLLYSKQSSFS